jgi:hypothetical protein
MKSAQQWPQFLPIKNTSPNGGGQVALRCNSYAALFRTRRLLMRDAVIPASKTAAKRNDHQLASRERDFV